MLSNSLSHFVGKLTEFYRDRNDTPDCGQSGTLSVRLKEGAYNYSASVNKFVWKGQFSIIKNGCIRVGLKQ